MPKTRVRGYIDERLIEQAVKQWPDLAFISSTSGRIDFVFRKALDLGTSTEQIPMEPGSNSGISCTQELTSTLAPKIEVEPLQVRKWTASQAKERFGPLRQGRPFSSFNGKR